MDRGPHDDAEGVGEVAMDVLGADRAVGEAALEGRTERVVAVVFEQVVQLIVIANPVQTLGRRWTSSVRYASAVPRRGRSGARARDNAWRVLAGDRGDARRTVLGQGRSRITTELAVVQSAAGHGSDPLSDSRISSGDIYIAIARSATT